MEERRGNVDDEGMSQLIHLASIRRPGRACSQRNGGRGKGLYADGLDDSIDGLHCKLTDNYFSKQKAFYCALTAVAAFSVIICNLNRFIATNRPP